MLRINRLSLLFGAVLMVLLWYARPVLAGQMPKGVEGSGTVTVTGAASVPPGCNVGDNPCEVNFSLTGNGLSNFTGPFTFSGTEHVNLGIVIPLFGQGPSPLCFPAGIDTNETTTNGDTLEIVGAGNACFNGSGGGYSGSWAIGIGSTGTGKFAAALGTGSRNLVFDLSNTGIFTDSGAVSLKH